MPPGGLRRGPPPPLLWGSGHDEVALDARQRAGTAHRYLAAGAFAIDAVEGRGDGAHGPVVGRTQDVEIVAAAAWRVDVQGAHPGRAVADGRRGQAGDGRVGD